MHYFYRQTKTNIGKVLRPNSMSSVSRVIQHLLHLKSGAQVWTIAYTVDTINVTTGKQG